MIQRAVESDGKVLNRSDTWKELRVQDCMGKRSPTYLHKFSLLAVVFRTATLSSLTHTSLSCSYQNHLSPCDELRGSP